MQKEYLDDNNNTGNSTMYLESIKEYMNKLIIKEEEINKYQQQIRILNAKLKEKDNEILKKNQLLKKYIMYSREGSVNFMNNNNNYNNNYYDISNSTDNKKPKSLKSQNFSKVSSSIINNNFHLKDCSIKEDLKRVNIHTKKNNNDLNNNIEYRNNSNLKNNYKKLLDNYNELKKKYNHYYKIAHNFKSKINSLNEERQKLMKNINLLTIKNNNLTKLISKYTSNNNNNIISYTKTNNENKKDNIDNKSIILQNRNKVNNTVSNINTNNNNLLLLLNNKNAFKQNINMNYDINNNELFFNEIDKQQQRNYNNSNNIKQMKINLIKKNSSNLLKRSSNDLISDDEKEDSMENGKINNNNRNLPAKNDMTNKATKKIYDAFEKYRELYNKKEKEYQLLNKQNQLLKSKIEEQIKIINEKDLKIKENEKTKESQNNLNMKLTEYFTMIDELETKAFAVGQQIQLVVAVFAHQFCGIQRCAERDAQVAHG